jgi:prepilin peptidase CpaA
MQVWFLGVALIVALLGAGWDATSGRIPNLISYSGIVLGLVLHIAAARWSGLASAFLGMVIGGGIFLDFFLIHAMGAGDVKLMAAVGCLAGFSKVLEIALASAITGGLLAIGYMVYHRKFRATLGNVVHLLQFHWTHGAQTHPEINLSNPEAIRMPYGIAIAAGVLYSFCVAFAGR